MVAVPSQRFWRRSSFGSGTRPGRERDFRYAVVVCAAAVARGQRREESSAAGIELAGRGQ
jgi:hypothetical protein